MSTALRLVRFACVGSVGTAIQYITLGVGVVMVPAGAAIWSTIGYALGSVANYLLNYHFTFDCSTPHGKAAAKYYAVLAVGLCFNGLMMTYLVRDLSWNHWVAQILTTTMTLLWNFAGSQAWAFRDAKVKAPRTGSVHELAGVVKQHAPFVLMDKQEGTVS